MQKHLLILLVLSTLALWPFAKYGYFESHDGEWMVIRFTAFHQALVSGQFPVRYVERLNNNYGYPVLNFLYPLPFYLAEFPKIIGFGFVNSIKIVFVVSSIASTFAMFWALAQIFSKNAATAGALIYLFVPYRFVDLYVRGSLGENLAFTFVPIIAGCIFNLAKGHIIYAPILSLAVGLLTISHNVMALLFLPFFFILSTIVNIRSFKVTIISFATGILTATFFVLPALYDLKFVRLSQIKISEITSHLVDFTKLLIPSWGYGPNPNSASGLSPQIGIVTTIIILATTITVFKSKSKNIAVNYFLLVFFLIVFANTKLSAVLWQNLPAADIIQFPWRMLAIVVFIAAFLTAYLIESAKSKMLLASLVIAAAVASTLTYIRPAVAVDKGDDYYATNEDTTNVRDEYLPLWARDKPTGRAAQKIELAGVGQIVWQRTSHLKYEAKIESPADTTVQINTIYFPDFEAKIDGKSTPISYNNSFGLINLKLPSGSHEVIINYTRSPVHAASEIISLVALLTTGAYFVTLWRKQNS